MLLLTVLLLVIVYTYCKVRRQLNYWKDKGVKYVEPVPLLGNMYPLMAKEVSSVEFVQNMYNTFPDERYCGLWQFTTPILMVRDPALIKQIMVKNFENFIDHTDSFSFESDPLWSNSLLATKGTKWKKLRHTISPAFTGHKMRTMFVLMDECAKKLVKHLHTVDVGDLDAKGLSERFANDVIASTAFGIQSDTINLQNNELLAIGKELGNFTGIKRLKFFIFGFIPSIAKILQVKLIKPEIGDFFAALIHDAVSIRRGQNTVRPDLIQLIMDAEDNRPEMTTANMVSLAVSFYIAGFDTTASLLAVTLYELAVNPLVQNRLRLEVQAQTPPITYEAVTKMKYLDMVVCETLRKWPQGFFLDRKCTKSFIIRENPGDRALKLEPGDSIWIPAYALQRDPKHFPDPDVFDPERFSDDNRSTIVPFTYLPFGEGPRNCIGNRFFLQEIKTFLFHILANFEIVASARTQNPLKLSKDSFIFKAEKGIYVGFKPLPS